MKTLLFLITLVIISQASAQDKHHVDKKLPPNLLELKSKSNNEMQQHFFIVTSDIRKLRQYLADKNLQRHIVYDYEPSNLVILSSTWKLVDSIFLPLPFVTFVDIVRLPKEETVIDGFDLSTNKISLVHNEFSLYNGNGTTVSVKENKPNKNDIDLAGRFISTPSASSNVTSHATIMSTIIAGAGNSYHTGKGVAWGADIISSDFVRLLPEANAEYKQHNVSVQNHSYGTGIENYYGADAAAYDASTISNPALLHVFSAGNSGVQSSATGRYAGINGYANLTGSFKMAKNIVTVGAIDSFYNVSPLSSRGPAYDGRTCPELVAFAQDGTSGAAAIVSGTALLLQQAYQEKNSGQLADAALIKALLLNSADDVGVRGIDYQSGFGSLNAYKAMQGVINKRYFSKQVSKGQVQSFKLTVPANVDELKITLCWSDIPADVNITKSLVNDIDLRLIHDGSGAVWQPWVLNSFPHKDSLVQLSSRKRDSLNNAEQITINQPPAGTYTVEVQGYNIQSAPQPYYIAYQWDSVDQFKWEYPTPSDYVYGGNTNTLRWASTFNGLTGKLYYSSDAGNRWNLIAENINLNARYFQWAAPDTFSTVVFRMQINNQDFVSEISTISSRLKSGVGFNCIDSFLIHWNKAPHILSYTVYHLQDKYLEPLLPATDTSIILKKSGSASPYYAVAPNIAGKSGIKSYALDYNTQGVGCYIKTFLVDLSNTNHGTIQFELGTTYNVKDIVIEKRSGNDFAPLKSISPATTLLSNFTDMALLTGSNTYRIRVNLESGEVIYSKPETIFYLALMNYLVYPNPARSRFHLVSKSVDDAELILYNTIGQKVIVRKVNSTMQSIPVQNLRKGLYFIHIVQNNKKVYHGTIVIQ